MVSDINTLAITGNLTRDSELRDIGNGSLVLVFSVANSRGYLTVDGWREKTSYFDCAIYGKRAEKVQKYLVKGKGVAIKGELQQDRWKDKQTGKMRSRVKIKVDDLSFLYSGSIEGEAKNVDGGGHFDLDEQSAF